MHTNKRNPKVSSALPLTESSGADAAALELKASRRSCRSLPVRLLRRCAPHRRAQPRSDVQLQRKNRQVDAKRRNEQSHCFNSEPHTNRRWGFRAEQHERGGRRSNHYQRTGQAASRMLLAHAATGGNFACVLLPYGCAR